MNKQTYNRILELSGLTEDVNKIKSIITDKIGLPEEITAQILHKTEKKHIALWVANTFKEFLLSDSDDLINIVTGYVAHTEEAKKNNYLH